jgi:hypothetical protein
LYSISSRAQLVWLLGQIGRAKVQWAFAGRPGRIRAEGGPWHWSHLTWTGRRGAITGGGKTLQASAKIAPWPRQSPGFNGKPKSQVLSITPLLSRLAVLHRKFGESRLLKPICPDAHWIPDTESALHPVAPGLVGAHTLLMFLSEYRYRI